MASLALSRYLTDRRNEISTLESPRNSSELAPEILSSKPGLIEVSVVAEGIRRRMELRVPHVPGPHRQADTHARCEV